MAHMNRLCKISIIIVIFLSISGCGTAHYFIPPEPLEKGQWQISVVWHYDLARLQVPRSMLFPDINAWVGAGQETNFGFGSSFLGPSHISAARYYSDDSNRNWIAYGNLQPFSLNNNPLIEVGAAYSFGRSSTKHMLFIGAGIGSKMAWPGFSNAYESRFGPSEYTPFYILRYSITGRTIGFSWVHYHGLTKKLVRNSFPGIDAPSDTVYTSTNVDSVTISNWGQSRFPKNILLAIWVKPPGAINFCANPYTDAFYDPNIEMSSWFDGRFAFARECGYTTWDTYWASSFVIDMKELADTQNRHGGVTILRYPKALKEMIDKISWLKNDHAFGFAIFSHPR
ncbi:MAG: hypothetical protein GY841_03525 [FCB group bacterium]|nr:hypothetical protein [FCB group bacterium]